MSPAVSALMKQNMEPDHHPLRWQKSPNTYPASQVSIRFYVEPTIALQRLLEPDIATYVPLRPRTPHQRCSIESALPQ